MNFNFLKENKGFLIRIDDITDTMNWVMMNRCEKLFDDLKIKPLLGVIPLNKDLELSKFEKNNDFWDKVLKWQDKGWEISMHGFEHKYSINTEKKDYFSYGGMSEFFNLPYELQKEKIEKGLQVFKSKKINIRSFFAPNHTYDKNTFRALKDSGIETVIDGYGLIPYSEHGLNFVPQLFYKLILLPLGVQSSQIHLNNWNEEEFINFKKFINKNKECILDYNEAIKKVNNNPVAKFSNFLVKFTLRILRKFKIS
tara:strand:+ start:215 stop:976 length:762 start_codon:yes stop_codon:yes gene_type:complete